MRWPFSGRAEELRSATAALSGRDARGLVIAGAPFVGRSRLFDEVIRKLPRDATVLRFAATRSGRGVPFGVLGADARGDVARARDWLESLAGDARGRRLVVAIDDVQFVDDPTAMLLHDVARAGVARLLLTYRRAHRAPDAVVALWKDELIARLDVGPLERAGSDELVSTALGGTVATALLQELWDLSRGYPLLLRELVLGAVDDSTIVATGGRWTSRAPLRATARLVDTIRALLDAIPDPAREALEVVALAEPAEPALLDRLVPTDVLAGLERRGVLTQHGPAGRYRIVAPALCMAIREAMAPSIRRALSRRLLDALDREATPQGQDLVRLARLSLDARGDADPDLLVDAGHAALGLFDLPLAERFARAAGDGGGLEARLVLADALAAERPEEAERVLGLAAEDPAANDAQRVRIAARRAELCFFRLHRGERAVPVLEATAGQLTDPGLRAEIDASLALYRSLRGELREAVRLGTSILDRDDAPDRARLRASTAVAHPLLMLGRLGEAAARAHDGIALSARPAAGEPYARPFLEMMRVLAAMFAGDLAEARAVALERYREALAEEAVALAGSWATHLAAVEFYRGDVAACRKAAEEARDLLLDDDPLGLLPGAFGYEAQAAAASADGGAATEAWEAMVAHGSPDDARMRFMEPRVRVVVLAAAGDLEQAATSALAFGRAAIEADHVVLGAATLHTAVRFGHPELVSGLLADVAADAEGRLMPAWAQHAATAAAQDAAGLEQVAETFAACGALLWAAEALAQASTQHARDGRPALAGVTRARAVSVAARCPGARTPPLRGLSVQPLTRREHEIALLAADGVTSREIADRLGLSTRTIDNHLAAVYRKLGIGGRGELAAALALDL